MMKKIPFCHYSTVALLLCLSQPALAEEVKDDSGQATAQVQNTTLPTDATVETLKSLNRDISLIKAQTEHQDALNALEESRRKLNVDSGTPAPSPIMPTSTPSRQPQTVSVTSRLLEIWSEQKVLRAAVEHNGQRISLRAGDTWPGSRFIVKSISARGVLLDNEKSVSIGGIL